MSKRWFILVFSLVFLFAFRVWMNDLSNSNKNQTRNTEKFEYLETGSFNIPLMLPSAKAMEVVYSDGNNLMHRILNPIVSTYDGTLKDYGFLYIFPNWPDSLFFNLREVVVNSNTVLNPNPYSDLIFQDF